MLSKTLIKELSKIQTPEQLAEVYHFGKDILDALAKASFKEGDSVFVVQKTKKTFGTIIEIKQKKAVVQMRGKAYRVPLSMLEVANI
jgi:hypothetical protein